MRWSESVSGVCDSVPSAEGRADVVAGGDAYLFDELGEVAAELGDAVSLPGVVRVAVSALVDGDDSELVVQGACYVVPVVGVAALPVNEQQVLGRRPSPVQVVDVEAVDLYVTVRGGDSSHGVSSRFNRDVVSRGCQS